MDKNRFISLKKEELIDCQDRIDSLLIELKQELNRYQHCTKYLDGFNRDPKISELMEFIKNH